MLTWNWNEKVGEIICKNDNGYEYSVTLYNGNALLIGIIEHESGKYCLGCFFCDIKHMKNCFGLTKRYGNYGVNIYEGCWQKIRINTKTFIDYMKVVKEVSKGFKSITIEFYQE